MGKRYHCTYCDKTMVAAPAIVKTHNKGVVHQKLVQEHYQQFKDPETIIAEESLKKPCLRYAKGECQFGGICRYSHYTKEEIQSMKDYVSAKDKKKNETDELSFEEFYESLKVKTSDKSQSIEANSMLYDDNGVALVIPWTYNEMLDKYVDTLPPSIRRLKMEDFSNNNYIVGWG